MSMFPESKIDPLAYHNLERTVAELEADKRRLAALLKGLRELHRPYGIYDQCGHEHELGDPGVVDVSEVGLCCEEGKLYDICYHCDTVDGELDEDSTGKDYPCATMKLVLSAEGPAKGEGEK